MNEDGDWECDFYSASGQNTYINYDPKRKSPASDFPGYECLGWGHCNSDQDYELPSVGKHWSEIGGLPGFLIAAGKVVLKAGELAVRCLLDSLTCIDNIKIAISPVISAALTVSTVFGLVLACTEPAGCVAAVPLLVPTLVGGTYATYRLAEEVWWGPNREEIYHELGGGH